MKSIKDVMTTDVSFCNSDDTVVEAAKKMKQIDAGAIPVCSSDRKLLGMVTDRDIVVRCVAEGKGESTKLQDVMSDHLISASADTSVQEASKLMAKHQIRRLPVVDRGELVGIVALGDLALEDKSNEAAGRALENISEHHHNEIH
ncbi:CBS domain-containing protein [Aquibacillus albus]|uniref:CBS domain-containing protein n=1 Tax=Aquibacillus albus TaxID=1168171 RepID=A0ABS2N293_9BACI|nr:CBS domain-containing protein [Aquibacillus albus]MBM7572256.1 CBS domain-containing protein [Aquibacillus albus]